MACWKDGTPSPSEMGREISMWVSEPFYPQCVQLFTPIIIHHHSGWEQPVPATTVPTTCTEKPDAGNDGSYQIRPRQRFVCWGIQMGQKRLVIMRSSFAWIRCPWLCPLCPENNNAVTVRSAVYPHWEWFLVTAATSKATEKTTSMRWHFDTRILPVINSVSCRYVRISYDLTYLHYFSSEVINILW